jgi:hypothetical protein
MIRVPQNLFGVFITEMLLKIIQNAPSVASIGGKYC